MKAITALGVGTLVGAAIAILVAPQSGETLAHLTRSANNRIERGTTKASQIARRANEVATKLRDQAQRFQSAVDAGVRAYAEARAALTLLKGPLSSF